jgi:hypothetical protein
MTINGLTNKLGFTLRMCACDCNHHYRLILTQKEMFREATGSTTDKQRVFMAINRLANKLGSLLFVCGHVKNVQQSYTEYIRIILSLLLVLLTKKEQFIDRTTVKPANST